MLPVAAASDRRRLITALHAHCAMKLSTSAAIAAGAKRLPALARAQVNNFLAQNGVYRRSVAASRPAPYFVLLMEVYSTARSRGLALAHFFYRFQYRCRPAF